MSVVVRPADLDIDAGGMIKLLAAHINPRYDHARFEWLYRRNPDGLARAWVAHESATGELVGTASAIPRAVDFGKRGKLGWVLSDFCVSDSHRALGPALQLQRACLASIDSGETPFCYDFPGAAMTAVYARLRVPTFGQMRRFVYPLRADTQIGALRMPPPLREALKMAANAILGVRVRRSRGAGRFVFSLLSGGCGPEFSDLSAQYAHEHGFAVRRSAAYLNWRFLGNPFQRHEILTARDSGRLLAYAVLALDAERPSIVDLFGPVESEVIGALLAAAVRQAHGRRSRSLSVTLLDSHPWQAALVAQGFHPRESFPVIFYAPYAAASGDVAPHAARCLLTQGDRDS